MRYIVTLVALSIASMVLVVSAANSTSPLSAPIYAYRDIPQHANQEVGVEVTFHGWAFNCNTGQQPFVINLWRYNNATGEMVQVAVTRVYTDRPDVHAVYAPYCPGLTVTTGYVLVPTSSQPPGDYSYQLLFADAPYSHQVGEITERFTVQ